MPSSAIRAGQDRCAQMFVEFLARKHRKCHHHASVFHLLTSLPLLRALPFQTGSNYVTAEEEEIIFGGFLIFSFQLYFELMSRKYKASPIARSNSLHSHDDVIACGARSFIATFHSSPGRLQGLQLQQGIINSRNSRQERGPRLKLCGCAQFCCKCT